MGLSAINVATTSEDQQGKPCAQPVTIAFSAWISLAYLQILYVVSLLDRNIVLVAAADIKANLSLSDLEFSFLLGAPFALFFAVASLPLGAMADKYHRWRLIGLCVGIWSLAAIGSGMSRSYSQLLGARLILGAGEAGLAPAAYSLIGDTFPRSHLSRATSLFAMSGVVGAGLSLALGGILISALTTGDAGRLAVRVGLYPWQFALIIVGLPGLLIASAAFWFREPVRKVPAGELKTTFRHLWTHQRMHIDVYGPYFVAFGAASSLAYAINTWAPVYMVRVLGASSATAGSTLGVAIVLAALISHPAIGALCDLLLRKGVRDAHFKVFAASLIIGLPIGIFTFVTTSLALFIVGIVACYVLLVPYLTYAVSTMQMITPSPLRGKMVSMLTLVMTLSGMGLGPTVVALFTDYVLRDEAELGKAVAITIALMTVITLLALMAGFRGLRRAVDAAAVREAIASA